jgi:hypothetical protein
MAQWQNQDDMNPNLLFVIVLALSATQLSGADVQGKVLNYGIFKKADKEEIIKTPETPSGVTRVPAGTLAIVSATNRIPAKIGIRFGITYEVSNLSAKNGEFIEVVKVTKHPAMTKPDGIASKGFTIVERVAVKDGRAIAQTGYGFDHEYELVPGEWQFEMKFERKTLLKQEFIVFRE